MRVHFVTCREQGIDFFPDLVALLQEEFPEMQPETYYVPTLLDIPLQAKQSADKADLVVVSFLYDKGNKRIEFVLRKLVEIELQTGTKVIKAFEESEVEELLTDEDRTKEKEAEAKKWSEFITNVILYPEKFSPEYSEETEEA
jgi:hypothetical protein